jgi:hypothetical protein
LSDLDGNKSDPSALTTAQTLREITSLKELVFIKLGEMEKAVKLLQDAANRSPTINEVYLQHEEKFKSVEKQFEERDVRAKQDKEASTKAVDAAFQAQKESAGKSEEQFTKQIEKQGELIFSEVKGLAAQMAEITNRLNRGEGKGEGADKNKTDNRLSIGLVLAIIGGFVGIIGMAFVIANFAAKGN